MFNRLFTITTLALVFIALPFSTSFAQPASPGNETVDAPVPLNVAPAGVARQDWEIIRDIVLSVPNPAGAAFSDGLVDGCLDCRGISASLTLDGHLSLYSYDCATGRCRGFATDIWRALPQDVKQAYIDSILDALVTNFPDQPRYAVWVGGQGQTGEQGGRVDLASNGERRYRFIGR